jgi:hypothetical protein
VLDKLSNVIIFVVLGSGGVLGAGQHYRPIPWSALDFDQTINGYLIPPDKEKLAKAPPYRTEDLTKADGGESAIVAKTCSHYNAPQYW